MRAEPLRTEKILQTSMPMVMLQQLGQFQYPLLLRSNRISRGLFAQLLQTLQGRTEGSVRVFL